MQNATVALGPHARGYAVTIWHHTSYGINVEVGTGLAIEGPDMRMPQKYPKRGGFTLIELLITTVIMAILASLAIPRFQGMREKAGDSAALGVLWNMSNALESYMTVNFQFPADPDDLIEYGYTPSDGVTLTQYTLETVGGEVSVHFHLEHAASTSYFHHRFPTVGDPEKRPKVP